MQQTIRTLILQVIYMLILGSTVSIATPKNENLYNSSSDNRLFHVERSKNKNIVCYDFNRTAVGELDKEDPLNVYWINREERPGERNGLSAIQQRLAYGYKVLAKSSSGVEIALNACKDRPMEIKKNGSQQYICLTTINNQLAILQKVYVKTKENNSLKVEYIELSGIVLASGMAVAERIFN